MSLFLKIINKIPSIGQIFKSDIADFDHNHNSRIEVEIDSTEFGSPVQIGLIPATSRVDKVVIDVLQSFDSGTITIGDDDAQGRLAAAAESDLTNVNIYVLENFAKYENETSIKIYPSGSPSQGQARIIVFYQ